MYMVIVKDSRGTEYLTLVSSHRDSAEREANRLRTKWTEARVSCAVDEIHLIDLVSRYETI